MNPAVRFNNGEQPFNNFLQQQTLLDNDGDPLWQLPDATPIPSMSSITHNGNTVTITIAVANQGDAAIGSPVHYTLYGESIASGNILLSDSAMIQINTSGLEYITLTIPDITIYQTVIRFFVRINDKGGVFPFQLECDMTNNVIEFINPGLSALMVKKSSLNAQPVQNGSYPNPVAVLYTDNIKYEITAFNANLQNNSAMTIVDTLPLYMNYVALSATNGGVKTVTYEMYQRDIITWNLTGLGSKSIHTVSYDATPAAGVCISQSMFINRAWIKASDTLRFVTNETYHQGAGVCFITFSAGLGGQIYNANPQALDFRTSALAGVVVAPDEGYRFTGWSHKAYTSLRGESIDAQSRIMRYDTLTIYGNVKLEADFELETYRVRYFLNGSRNHADNPDTYTVESHYITLEAPEKAGDVFTGWTGSNGLEPQTKVDIPKGSTGERTYFANFLYSGRENRILKDVPDEERIWVYDNELYIYTTKTGSVVRIYTTTGVLRNVHTIVSAGESKIKLPSGVYIVTLNNGLGQKMIVK